MKYVRITWLACLIVALATPAYAGRDRCTEQKFTMVDAYHILRWAVACKKNITPNSEFLFHAYWTQANVATRDGTYFPAEGSAAYENLREEVGFPSYFVAGSTTDVWRGPEDPATLSRMAAVDCTLPIPARYSDATFCPSGCYAPNQYVLFGIGAGSTWLPIGDAYDKQTEVVTLAAGAAMDELQFTSSPIDYFISDPKPIHQKLLKLVMQSGGALTVTTNHPLLEADGAMHRARDLTVGDRLVRQDGSTDPVTAIEPVDYYGRVFNLDTKDANPSRKILLANGYLSGSHWYQDLGQTMLNRLLVRASNATRLED